MSETLRKNRIDAEKALEKAIKALEEFSQEVEGTKRVVCKDCNISDWTVRSDTDLYHRLAYRSRNVYLICNRCGGIIKVTEDGGYN